MKEAIKIFSKFHMVRKLETALLAYKYSASSVKILQKALLIPGIRMLLQLKPSIALWTHFVW